MLNFCPSSSFKKSNGKKDFSQDTIRKYKQQRFEEFLVLEDAHMILPDRLFIIAVPYSWYQSVKAQYIASGSCAVSCYGVRVDKSSASLKPQSGEPVFFEIKRDGKRLICGGGFYQRTLEITPLQCWQKFGVNNGAENKEEFLNILTSRGWSQGKKLLSHEILGTFVFSSRQCYELPNELGIKPLSQGELTNLETNTPEGRFLWRFLMHERSFQLQEGVSDGLWQGIYHLAEEKKARDYYAMFAAKMLKVYDFKCAVTSEATAEVLEVAHIRTFYDERFFKPDNGLVLRADFEKLFAKGYITVEYRGDDAFLKVSKTLKLSGGDEYLRYDGVKLNLPKDPQERPSREYLSWHRQNRFENWLSFGAVRPLKLEEKK